MTPVVTLIAGFGLGFWTHAISSNYASGGDSQENNASGARAMARTARPTRTSSHTAQTEKEQTKLAELLRQVEAMKDSDPDPACLRLELAYAFADQDPDAGFAWLTSLDPTGPHANSMMIAFAIRLGINDSEKWKKYHSQLNRGSLKDAYLSSAVIGVGHNDAVKAWRDYQALADETWNRQSTDKHVFDRLAQANPESFWAIVQELKKEHAGKENTQDYEKEFFTYAVFEDQQVAVRLLESVTDADLKNQYVQMCLKNLYREKLVEFGNAVITGQFIQKEKDNVLFNIANRVYSNNLGEGAKLAMAIADDELRRKVITQIRLHAQRQGPDIEQRIEKVLVSTK
ncbi:hypothetical protein [Oceaniferula spumae]|uniref:hypothetical protein n=1 Tax=Oceaniferula spumae TaxID=2979115 RepID=UPI003F4E5086